MQSRGAYLELFPPLAERLIPPLLAALLLAWLLSRSGVESYAVVVPITAFFAYVVSASGRMLLASARAHEDGPSAAWVLGLLGTCLAVYGITRVLPISAATAFAVLGTAVIAVESMLAWRAARGRRSAAQTDWRALAGFALCVALTAAWCGVPAGAYETVRTQGVLPVWSDYFFHAGLISQFGDARALGRASIYLADHPSSFYHFASYGVAAALAGALDQPGLPLATAAWLPLGFLAMLTGAYTLGTRLAGPVGGIAALAAVAMLPDASNYGLRNGLFSFHWTLMAHAGATYALAAAFLSLALLDRWSTARSRTALIASGLLAVSTLLFRLHVFVLYLPAWIAIATVCGIRNSSRQRVTAGLMIAVLAAGAVAGSMIPDQLAAGHSPHWRFGERALDEFLMVLHTGQEPTAYTDVYADLVKRDSPGLTLIAGIVLAVVAGLGAFMILLPAAALLAHRTGVLKPIDWSCAYLVFWWLLLMLFVPKPWHGDPTDLIHRPLVLVYTASAIWTLCLLLRVLATRFDPARRLWPAVLAAAILALPAVFAGAQKMASPKPLWAAPDAAARVTPGLVEAADFLRKHAAVGDIFAASGMSPVYAPFDLSMQLCALSGMPAYLSRPYFEMIKDAPRKEVVTARLAALTEVDRQTSYEDAMAMLRRQRVQWYVVADGHGPRWDEDRKRAAFTAARTSLYSTSRQAGL